MGRGLLLGVGLLLWASGCAPVVGDACRTESDCGGQICLGTTYAPDGYCTRQCTTAGQRDACPEGSTCVTDAIARGLNGCLRKCDTVKDCRSGYECRAARDSNGTVCVGPTGL